MSTRSPKGISLNRLNTFAALLTANVFFVVYYTVSITGRISTQASNADCPPEICGPITSLA
jgi:hypothetical protein